MAYNQHDGFYVFVFGLHMIATCCLLYQTVLASYSLFLYLWLVTSRKPTRIPLSLVSDMERFTQGLTLTLIIVIYVSASQNPLLHTAQLRVRSHRPQSAARRSQGSYAVSEMLANFTERL